MLPDPIFTIFGRGIYMYGIMIAVGILACFLVLYGYGKLLNVSTKLLDFCFYNGIGSIVVGFGGAALWQAFYNYIDNPARGFRFGSGITVVPGLVCGAGFFLLIYFTIYRRISEERLLSMLPIAPCCILIAHAFGRVGCFFAGCCHGRVSDSIFAIKFPEEFQKVLPTQLWEAIFLFLLFGVCSFLLLKYKYRLTLPLYTFTYGIFRFINEFFRGDSRGSFIPGLSPTQFWCILIVIGSVPMYILLKRAYARFDATRASVAPTPCEEVSEETTPEAGNTSTEES